MIRAIIIEDEEDSRRLLVDLLAEHFKNITVLAVCENAGKAKIGRAHV